MATQPMPIRALHLLLMSCLLVTLGCDSPSRELPKLGQIQQFELKRHDGSKITPKTLSGRPYVAAFMFTRCPTVCPKLTHAMRDLQEEGKGRGLRFDLVSFSVDPENDTPEVLRAFAKKHQLDLTNWHFVTGDPKVIEETAVKGFKLALQGKAKENAEHYGLLHGTHLVLVDKSSQIRGYYQSKDKRSMEQLLAAIAKLSAS